MDGVPARFKKFNTIEEAERFMNEHDARDYVRKPFTANSTGTDNPSQVSYLKLNIYGLSRTSKSDWLESFTMKAVNRI